MKKTSETLRTVKLKEARKIVESSCGTCDYDEAEGGLINHCDKCCRRIVTELWPVLVLS